MKVSLNGNLILTPYTKTKELKTKQVATGFAMTANKTGIDSLELLVDAVVNYGNMESRVVKKGSKVFFKEHLLYTQEWPRQVLDSKEHEEGFVVGNLKDVLYIEEKE